MKISVLSAIIAALCISSNTIAEEHLRSENNEKKCVLGFWWDCQNQTVCPAGTPSAGHLCHQTILGYTYVLGIPVADTGCGCAPPAIPYHEKDAKVAISEEVKAQIAAEFSGINMQEVLKYEIAVKRAKLLIDLEAAERNGEEHNLLKDVASGCQKGGQ